MIQKLQTLRMPVKVYLFSFLIVLIAILNGCQPTFDSLSISHEDEKYDPPIFESYQKKIDEDLPFLRVVGSYPQFIGLPEKVNMRIANHMKTLIATYQKRAQDFIIERLEDQQEEDEPFMSCQARALVDDDSQMELEIVSYQIYQANKQYLSIKFELWLDRLQGHPEWHIDCINYDVKKKKLITLADLFPSDPSYLEKIAFLCRKQLIVKTAFNTFAFTADAIEFFFQEYTIFGLELDDIPSVLINRKDIEQLKIQ